MLRVAICHPQISGYVVAGWRALAARREFDLLIVAHAASARQHASFHDDLVSDLPCRLLSPEQQDDAELVRSIVVAHRPDVVYVPGWAVPAYNSLAWRPELASARFVMGMDTSLRLDWRQRLARWRLRRYLNRMSRVVVIGERAWQYARYLGVPEKKLRRGLYAVDYPAYARQHDLRLQQPGGWPRRFLYLGRYVDVKGIDVLLEAFRRYRASVSQPWGLSCCGQGPWAEAIRATEGAEDLGFIQPDDLGSVLARHGCFVIASRYEPWALVLVEAAASGLPIIYSEACGAGVEMVRPYYNGIGVATGDIEALTSAMRWMHEHYERLPEMGRNGQCLARAFDAGLWAERWSMMFRELADEMPGR